MISLENICEFVPHGRKVSEHHPSTMALPTSDRLNHTDEDYEEHWTIGPKSTDELYFKGHTVIWSSGGHAKKCFTNLEPVREVVRCHFFSSLDRPSILPFTVHQEPNGDRFDTICVRYSNNIRIFCDTGDDYKVALQFGVLNTWKSKFGLILERQVLDKEKPYPVVFCLLHPLDDLTRVIWKQGLKISELLDQTQQIVYSDDESSIVITYNSQTDLHSVWRVRRAYHEEKEAALRMVAGLADSRANSPLNTGANTSLHSAALSLTPTNTSTKLGCGSPTITSASVGSKSSRQPSGFSTPAGSRTSRQPSGFSTAAITPAGGTRPSSPSSRINSPHSLGILLRSGVSPSFSSKVTARLGECTGRLNKLNFTAVDEERYDTNTAPLPLDVTLCFEHIWTEPLHQRDSHLAAGKASKVFLSRDTVGRSYFCLLLPSTGQLNLVKYKYANEDPAASGSTLIFGTIEKIAARDAAPLADLSMILVLEPSGSICLYSGASRVGKTILPPISTVSLSQEISAMVIDSKSTGMPSPAAAAMPDKVVGTAWAGFVKTSTPMVKSDIGFDRQSTRLRRAETVGHHTTTKPTAVFDNDLSLMSPMNAGLSGGATLTAVRDACGRQVSMVYSTGYMLRVTLPPVSSAPLVWKSLEAVKQLLPKDLAQQLHGQWYTKRHAPGPTPSPAVEWDMFCKCVLGMTGYQIDRLDLSSSSSDIGAGSAGSCTGGPGPKKSKTELQGTDGDWQYLLDSPQHVQSGHSISKILRLEHVIRADRLSGVGEVEQTGAGQMDPTAPLFLYLPALFWSLHLLYEELKLDTSLYGEMPFLANLLSRLAADLKLSDYQHHYWRDFPENSFSVAANSQRQYDLCQLSPELLARLSVRSLINEEPPCIYTHLRQIQLNQTVKPFPIIHSLNPTIKLITAAIAALSCHHDNHAINLEHFLKPLPQPGRPAAPHLLSPVIVGENPAHAVAELLSFAGWDRIRIGSLPLAVAVPISSALSECQLCPDPAWSISVLTLVGREDMALNKDPKYCRNFVNYCEEHPDGLEGLDCDISRLRWPKDLRTLEARRILQSSKPVVISIEQGPEVSDHDFVEEQEYFLKRMCERTMALPVGRGIASLRTTTPLPTEVLSIPQLCLTGKAPPRGTRVELTHIDYSQNMDHWPSFHNGVAAGLRLVAQPNSAEIDATWISFNKPPSNETNVETEHAGFLMALGLNGHLTKLSMLDAYEYLNKGCEPISIGLLIGVAASYLGTMDVMVTKKLSTQLEALLPPSATELPLTHNTQVAALMGVGLLYANTGHRHMVEVCVRELGKPPGPELENCVDRESYSLSAGLSLGLITMGQGESLVVSSLADLNLPNVLHNYMLGGPRPTQSSSANNSTVLPAKDRPQSYQIMEGDSINIDITSPGATLALGMMYFRSGNRSVAAWMKAPDTIFLLDFVRPDFLMLRTLARGLILWDDIEPTLSWIESHVPATMLPHCLVRPPDKPPPGQENLDYETLNQAYCNIVSGAAFVLALRYAGTWNQVAFETLEHLLKKCIAIAKRSIAELTGKAVIEQTICILVLAQGIVMAGSGDLAVLRTCRYLRARVHTSTVVTYGSHMAVHMAAGLLFLGGGRYGLASTPSAVAAMIVAFFPKFPTHSNDNRYHLQAFRHLYVLAVQPRLLVTRCSQTGQIVPCTFDIQYAATDISWRTKAAKLTPSPQQLEMLSPLLLPSLDLLASVSVADKQFWPVSFNKNDTCWATLAQMLELGGGNMTVKRLAAVLGPATTSSGFQWSLSDDDRERLEQQQPLCATLLGTFLRDTPAEWRATMESLVATCVAQEQMELIPVIAGLISLPNQLSLQRAGLVAHQLRLIFGIRRMERRNLPLDPELVVSLLQRVNSVIGCASSCAESVRNYVSGRSVAGLTHTQRQMISSLVAINGLPRGSPVTMNNPLKMLNVLGSSPNPAALYSMLKASS